MERLFLALFPSPKTATRLASLLGPLGRRFPTLRWVPLDQIHLTVHFLGNQDRKALTDLWRALDASIRTLPAPSAFVGSPVLFPSSRQPRLLVLPASRGNGLDSIVRTSAAVLDAFQVRRKDARRPFHAHLTVARIPNDGYHGDAFHLPRTAVGLATFPTLTLVRSDLRPTGSRYHILRTFPFASP